MLKNKLFLKIYKYFCAKLMLYYDTTGLITVS